ncbi:MAG: hypothetical protein ACK5PB_08170 [Pirellula sp.]
MIRTFACDWELGGLAFGLLMLRGRYLAIDPSARGFVALTAF